MQIKYRDGFKILLKVFDKDLEEGGVCRVPDDIDIIEERAFASCRRLTRVDMPSVTIINSGAFFGLRGLISVNMPRVTTIKQYAFWQCEALTRVDIPSATVIGENAFSGCTSLTHANMPSAITIEIGAFQECTDLTRVEMPRITVLGDCVFVDCSALTHVNMPSTITTIADTAFDDCAAFTHIIVADTEVERVRALLPEHLQGYVLYKSVADWQQQALDEFCNRCHLQKVEDLVGNEGSIHSVLQAVSKFSEKPVGFSQFEAEVLQASYRANPKDMDAYILQIREISEKHIAQYKNIIGKPIADEPPQEERHSIAHKLERYIRILKRVHPNSFLPTEKERPKVREEHRMLRTALDKVITFLQQGTAVVLSDEEKGLINERPELLKIIPQDLQEELRLHSEPAPALRIEG